MNIAAEFQDLDTAWLAAAEARQRWLSAAWSNDGGVDRAGKQIPPDGDWDQIIFKAGRGFGKTQALVQWQWWECWRVPGIIGHAVAPTLNDARGTLFLGPSGFKATIPPECLRGGSWDNAVDITHLEIYFANGSMIRGFGAADQGGRLRGPQCHNAIGDELREWDRPSGNLEQVHSNMMMGVRMPYPDGTPARAVFATTPRPIPFLKKLYDRAGVEVVHGTTYENLSNLSRSYRNTVLSFDGTKFGKAEIYGQDISEEEIGIFKRAWFRLWPANKPLPEFSFVVASMDTAFEEEAWNKKKQEPDYSACGVYGIFNTKQCFTPEELKKLGVRHKYAALLCDFWMDRLGFPELLEKSRVTYRTKYGKKPGKIPDIMLIENKASGISLRQSLGSFGVPVWPFNPGGQSKLMRAHAASPIVLQGGLFLPESTMPDRKGSVRDWVEPLLEQVCSYAGEGTVQFDDGLDSMTAALLYFLHNDMLMIEPSGLPKPDPEELREQQEQEARRLFDEERKAKVSPYGA